MIIIYILGFILGTALGSFINMLSYRLYNKKSLSGRSFADGTGEPLSPIDLIPIVSYVIFKGKSRTSGEKLPLKYPIIEFISGISFLLVFASQFDLLIPYSEMFLNLSVAIVCIFFVLFFAVYDFEFWQLHRKMLAIAIGFVIILNLLGGIGIQLLGFDFSNSIIAAIVTAFIGSIIVTISKRIKGRLEYNDVLFLTFLALLLGASRMFWVVLFGTVLGSIVGVFVMFISKKGVKTAIPFAPLFYIPTVVFLLYETEVFAFLSSLFGV